MATTKKTTTTKSTTTKKATVKVEEPKVAEKNIFEAMAERFPAVETPVDTGAGIVNVKNKIPMSDMLTLINLIVEMCVNGETGEVKWEVYDFAVKACIVATYCGVSIPGDLDVAYAAVCGKNGLYLQICDDIDSDQLNEIWDSVRDKLESRDALNQSIALGRLNEFLNSVESLMNTIGEMSENFDGEEAVKALGNLSVLTGGK